MHFTKKKTGKMYGMIRFCLQQDVYMPILKSVTKIGIK